MERLGASIRGVALDPANRHEPVERIRPKPRARGLRSEMPQQELHLSLRNCAGQRHVEVGDPQVALVFWNLVLEREMVPERVPRQLADHSVVLMIVVPTVAKYEIWVDLPSH